MPVKPTVFFGSRGAVLQSDILNQCIHIFSNRQRFAHEAIVVIVRLLAKESRYLTDEEYVGSVEE